jgi:hypothetical protein
MLSYRIMASKIHIPKQLQKEADWSPGFFEQLSTIDPDAVEAVDELLDSVRKARTSKPPGLQVEDWSKP